MSGSYPLFLFSLPISDPTWIFFLVLAIILTAPLLLGRLRIPHVVGLILAGILVGPHCLNLLERDSSFELFGKVGIYYIMFLAGLEMDMASLERHWRRGLTFGVLTFGLPFACGLMAGRMLMGLEWQAALLLACIMASHTLVAYPIVGRYGAGRHPSVGLSIVATALATMLALLILAALVGAHTGGGGALFWTLFALKCAAYGAVVIAVFPKLARWFFRKYDDSVMQYIFVLALVFLSAALAQLAGLEGLLGAFLTGLTVNRQIPRMSPLMNRIEFVGNALFIPYFLIGVGMIINLKAMTQGSGGSLGVMATMVAVATASKWLAAAATQKFFRLNKDARNMMFGLTNAHAAGALAMVMVGTGLELQPGVKLMDDNLLNGTVMLILVSCILSSLATEKASRNIALTDSTLEDNRGSSHGRCLVALANPATVEALTQVGMMIRNPRTEVGLTGMQVTYDEDDAPDGERQRRLAARNLEKARTAAAAAGVKMKTMIRVSNNIASGIVHTMKEQEAGEVVLGLHHKAGPADSFFGSIAASLLKATRREVMLVRCLTEPMAWRHVSVAVPPKAEYEVGFYKWLEHLGRMGRQLACRMHFHAHPDTSRYIRGYMEKMHPGVRAEYADLESWEDLLMLTSHVSEDHLTVIVSARRGFISYDPAFERLPLQITRYFGAGSIMLLYPDQNGDPQEEVSLFEPATHAIAPRRYDDVSRRIYKWLKG
ncbi:MAG: cation:proton antiporter [Bacteroides sp.]|nr:cation:proton antiporter [Bacteroides sp.]